MEKINCLKMEAFISIVFLIIMTFVCPVSIAGESSIVSTDKDTYNYGETIKVNFSNSPGNERDWICIVPAGFPDGEVGDYKYLPKGLAQGFLTFAPPAPGKYEARAYYDYERKGYKASGRYAFAVRGGQSYERELQLKMELMARKANPNNSIETNLASGNGIVYVVREPWALSSNIDVQIKANDKPIVVMKNSDYFLFTVPEGKVNFTSGSFFDHSIEKNTNEVWSVRSRETIINVKAGYVYYLKVKVIPMGGWSSALEHIPHQDGAVLINSYKLNLVQ